MGQQAREANPYVSSHVNVLVNVNVNVPETGVLWAEGIAWKAWLQSL